MNKTTKLLTLVLLVLCLVAVFCLAACGDDTPQGATYSVTVKLPDGSAVENVSVKWGSYGPVKTGKDGKASIILEEGEYALSLTGLPEGYGYKAVSANKDNKDVEIILVLEGKITYTVTVLYPDQTPVSGVALGLCNSENCYPAPAATDAQGKVQISLDPDEYHAKVTSERSLPDGFTYEQDENGYYTGASATAQNPNLTIVLKALTELEIRTAGTYKVVMQASQDYVTVRFQPSATGRYAIYSVGDDYDPKAVYVARYDIENLTYDEVFDELKCDNKAGLGKNFYFDGMDVEEGHISNNVVWTYRIYLNAKMADGTTATVYPATLSIKVERLGDIGSDEREIEIVRPTVDIVDCTRPNDDTVLVPVEISAATASAITKGDDGLYRLGDELVYVNLNNTISYKHFQQKLLGMDETDGINQYVYVIVKGNEYEEKNFSWMLRGKDSFYDEVDEDYAYDYYAKHLNSDGAYYLNDDLLFFLQSYTANAGFANPGSPDNAFQWLFACCTYGDDSGTPGEEIPEDGVLKMGSDTKLTFSGAEYDTIRFTPAESGDYFLVVKGQEAYDCYYCPLAGVWKDSVEYGEKLYSSFELEADSDNNYNIRFHGDKDVEITFYLQAEEDYTEAVMSVAVDNSILPNVVKVYNDVTEAEGKLACNKNDYYDIVVKGSLQTGITSEVTISVGYCPVTLEDDGQGGLIARHVLVYKNSVVQISCSKKESLLSISFVSGLSVGYNSYVDLTSVTTFFGAETDDYYDISVFGDILGENVPKVTITINDTPITLDEENKAEKVLIPAFAKVVISAKSGTEKEVVVNVAINYEVEEVQTEETIHYTFNSEKAVAFRVTANKPGDYKVVIKGVVVYEDVVACPVVQIRQGSDIGDVIFDAFAVDAVSGYYYAYFTTMGETDLYLYPTNDESFPLAVEFEILPDPDVHVGTPKLLNGVGAEGVSATLTTTAAGCYDVVFNSAFYAFSEGIEITLKINGEVVALTSEMDGFAYVARHVTIPAGATIFVSTNIQEGEDLKLTLTAGLGVGFHNYEDYYVEAFWAGETGSYDVQVLGEDWGLIQGKVSIVVGDAEPIVLTGENSSVDAVVITKYATIKIETNTGEPITVCFYAHVDEDVE